MTNSTNPVFAYADDVLHKRIIACEKVTLACERYVRELAESEKPSYPYRFDIETAMRPVRFMETFLRPSKGEYTKLELMPWQVFVEGNIYGWLEKDTGKRRFREALEVVGRGNGKSTKMSGSALYAASKDNERGADVYLLANVKQQAGIVFEECTNMVFASPVLSKHFRALSSAIYYDATMSRIQPRASDSRNLQGLNAHLGIFDEISEFEDYGLLNAIRRSMAKRRQPLIRYMTALGTVLDGPLMDLYNTADSVLKEDANPMMADRMFCYIAELDANDDIEDSTKWIKANPSIGKLLMLDDLIYEWSVAKRTPKERGEFINRQLNIFTNVAEAAFLDYDVIKRNDAQLDVRELTGRSCYGGFDLSATEDFTSACLLFPLSDRRFFVLSHSWVPQAKVDRDNEHIPYREYELLGHLTICPGDHIDQEDVLKWFCEMREKYEVLSIGYDPANAPFLVRQLQSKGFVLNVVRQGALTLNGPMKECKNHFLEKRVITNNDPLFRWYLNNVRLTKDFYAKQKDNWMPTKAHRYRKIDGFMAYLFALTEYIRKHTIIDEDREVEIQSFRLY